MLGTNVNKLVMDIINFHIFATMVHGAPLSPLLDLPQLLMVSVTYWQFQFPIEGNNCREVYSHGALPSRMYSTVQKF